VVAGAFVGGRAPRLGSAIAGLGAGLVFGGGFGGSKEVAKLSDFQRGFVRDELFDKPTLIGAGIGAVTAGGLVALATRRPVAALGAGVIGAAAGGSLGHSSSRPRFHQDIKLEGGVRPEQFADRFFDAHGNGAESIELGTYDIDGEGSPEHSWYTDITPAAKALKKDDNIAFSADINGNKDGTVTREEMIALASGYDGGMVDWGEPQDGRLQGRELSMLLFGFASY
jgi:hypothetical protein